MVCRKRNPTAPVAVILAAAALCACGERDAGESGRAAITDRSLADAIAIAEQRSLEDRALFDVNIAPQGARCRGVEARWTCTLFVQVTEELVDLRTYDVRVDLEGCWRALQTGADLRATGRPKQPTRPERLRGCL